MKTSVAKKLRDRVLAAFLAIAVMLSYVLPSSITASAAEKDSVVVQAYGDGNGYSGQLNFSEFELSYTGEDGKQHFLVKENEDGITPSIAKSTDFTFLFDWNITPGSDLEKALNEAFRDGKDFEMVCDLSEELKGFSFGDSLVTGKTVEITDGDGTLSVTFSFEGTTLHIHVNEKGNRTTNYKGKGEMNGSISLEKDECSTNGEAELKFFDKECKVIVSDYAPDVNVVKESTGIVEKDGELYLKFKTVITAKSPSNDIYLDDEFTYNGMSTTWGGTYNSIFDGDSLEDILVNGKPVEEADGVTVENNGNGNARLHFDSVEEGDTVVEYLIKANPASNENSTNHAEIKDSDDNILSKDDAWVTMSTPQVSKSNGGLKNGDEVEWTITVKKNVLDELKDSKNFTVTDKPQAGIDEASMDAAMKALGATGSFADGYEIPFDKFTKQEDGSYTLSYTTKITEDFLNTLSGKTVTNKVTAEFEDLTDVPDDTFTGESDLHIDGIGEIEVTKEMYASKGGVFSWKSTIKVPRCDLDMIEITDESAWNVWDGKTYVTHRVLPDSIKVNGQPLKDVAAEGTFTNTEEFASYKFGFKFSDEYIEKLNNELADDADEFVITIEYDTQVVDEDGNFVNEYDTLSSITNKMSVTAQAKNEPKSVSKDVTCTVDPEFKVNKEYVASWATPKASTEGLSNPLVWRVNISSYDNTAADKIFEKGKVITITDTLPEGYELGDYVLCFGSYSSYYDQTTKDGVKVTKDFNKDGRQVVTFEITVTDEVLKSLTEYPGGWGGLRSTWAIAIEYSTGMNEEYAAEFMMTHKNGDEVSFVNSADVFYDGGLIGNNLEATGTVTVNINDILTKENIALDDDGTMFDYDDKGAYVLFKITLNPDKLPIGGYDEDGNLVYETITAEDTLGTSMTYGGDVKGLLPGDEVKVSKNGRKLQFILKNKTAYEITYKARITGTKEHLTDEEEAERYSNVVAITCNNITSDNTSATVEASVYAFVLSVSADTERAYFTISGTKTWDDNGNIYRPDHITLNMVRHNLTSGEDEEFTLTVGKTFGCDITLEEDDIDGNKWSFTVDDPSLLYTKLGDNKYSYSITEATDNKGYTLKNITADLGNITNDDIENPTEIELEITNEMVKTSVTIEKKWVGGTDRPDVTVTLSDGNKFNKDYTLNAANGWKVTVEDLPKYDSDGNEITYTVIEDTPSHYTSEVTNDGKGNFTVTNTYEVEYTDITITKEWVGGEKDRPDSVTITLKGTDGYSNDYVLNDDNDWTVTVEDLPKCDSDGNEITYTVIEDTPSHYTSEVTNDGYNFTVTNTYEVEYTDITITKVWLGGKDRPEVTVTLSDTKGNSNDYVLNDDNDWTVTVEDLPKCDSDGNEIKYSVTEKNVDHYTSKVTNDGYNFTVTNTYEVEYTDITITKEWIGGEKDRPDSVTVTLKGTDGYSNDYVLNDDNDWTVTVEDLPKCDSDGNEITYTVTEKNVDHYTSKVTNDGYNFTVTNTYEVEYTDIEVTKVWGENLEKFNLAKQEVTVHLYQNGKEYDTLTLNDKNGWTDTFKDLPKTDNDGNAYVYTVEEVSIAGFNSKSETDKDGNVTITNTVDYSKYKTSVSGVKTWIDFDNKFGKRPESLTIELYAGNVKAGTCTTDASKGWKYSFDNLDKYDPLTGKTIVYTVKEADVKYYTSAVDGYNITNTLDTAKVTIQKVDKEGKLLKGAALQILDSTGKVVDEWTTTESNPHEVELIPDEKYTLKETSAPKGYVKAGKIEFTVNKDGKVTIGENTFDNVEMKDDTTKVQISKKDITGGNELPGAHLVVVDENGDTIEDFYSSDEPTYFEAEFEAGKTYTLREETAPNGYAKAEEVKFTVSENGDIDYVEMTDDTTKVEISKQDLTTGKELAGAKLKVVDKDGNVIKEWTSTNEPTYFENVFKAGEAYTLIEETAPDGYVKAEEVKFTVSEDGSVDRVVMEDDTTKVEISKQDLTTGKELAGAKLKVVDKDGNVIKEWTSTDKPTYFENVFKAGETYTLIEETAPDGYVKAEEVKFTVSEDGSVDKVVMEDDTTKVEISKQDLTTGKELAGAKLKVVDKDGNVIKEWTSTDKPHEINGVLVAGGTYTLHEEVAPDGYVVANDIEFVVNADGTVTKVTMIDEAKSGTDLDDDSNDKDSGVAQGGGSNDKDKDTDTGTNDKSPITGDSSNVTLALVVMALGMVLMANRKCRNH